MSGGSAPWFDLDCGSGVEGEQGAGDARERAIAALRERLPDLPPGERHEAILALEEKHGWDADLRQLVAEADALSAEADALSAEADSQDEPGDLGLGPTA